MMKTLTRLEKKLEQRKTEYIQRCEPNTYELRAFLNGIRAARNNAGMQTSCYCPYRGELAAAAWCEGAGTCTT